MKCDRERERERERRGEWQEEEIVAANILSLIEGSLIK